MAARPPSRFGTDQGELTPRQLADAWKRQGGFDTVRKQLLVDFLQSEDRAALLAELDTLLPSILASTPSLAQKPKHLRPAEVLSLVEQRGTLNGTVSAVEGRLRAQRGKGRKVERELRKVLCEKKGIPFVDDGREDEEEEPVVVVKKEEPAVETSQQDETSSVPSIVANVTLPSSSAAPAPSPVLPQAAPSQPKLPSPSSTPSALLPTTARTPAPSQSEAAGSVLPNSTADPQASPGDGQVKPDEVVAAPSEDVEMSDAAPSAAAPPAA
ncbi:uncharacterized protein JCM10292_000760 [Rhodotorula paludigena]|uniref:uncharacterized protein n=1 Tax=Rhodotorula paludigena TaxID=86838 RepID=UPI003179115B